MKCPNCEQGINKGGICQNCGMDAVVYSKICAASDALYNRGLQKVRLKDLSGAIECLSKSVEFNRKNINARNLLGLTYYEMGELGEALRHWVISSSLSKTDKTAAAYIERIQVRTRELDKFNDAINMYNKALLYVQQKSEDMAIIQLRKAVDINPKFVIAMNLLAFCYLIRKEKEQARLLIERVLAIDTNNAIAMNYLIELGVSRSRTDSVQKPSGATSRQIMVTQSTGGYKRMTAKDKKSFGTSFPIAQIFFFIVGGMCAMWMFYYMILPSELETSEAKIEQLRSDLAATAVDFAEQRDKYAEEIQGLMEEISDHERLNLQLNERLAQQDKIQEAYRIVNLFNSGLVEETAEAVYSFDTSGLPADVLESLIDAKEQSFRQVAQTSFNEGARDYNARRYDDAKENLGRALRFADLEANFMPDVLYLLGLIAEQQDGDTDEALRYFQMVVTNYPNSNRYNTSLQGVRRLSE